MTEPITLPTLHSNMFDPPGKLQELRASQPIARLLFADGHLGWLITDHATASTILADRRFSSRQDIRHMPLKTDALEAISGKPAKPGMFLFMDPPDHTKYRRLLAGQFTMRRMRQLTPHIEQIVARCLDDMESAGPPADLIPAFSLPIPSMVICELLGVPYGEREEFQHNTNIMQQQDLPLPMRMKAIGDLLEYVRGVVMRKKKNLGDDVVSGLFRGGEASDEEITGMLRILLVGGHMTVANQLGLGTFALLQHPQQLAVFRSADEAGAAAAVDEILRYATILHTGVIRVALEDADIDGTRIKAGESVSISLSAANRDPKRFPDADAFDVSRDASGHIAFAFGVHQCLGQQLARIGLRVGLTALFRRFPGLRLAVPPDQVPLRENMIIYGVHELPVTW
jgi:cytochrome P450